MKSFSLCASLACVAICSTSVLAAPETVKNMGNVRGGDSAHARRIIDQKCTACHSGKIVEAAIFANKDMLKIQKEMEKKGAKLDASERDVLGIYWKEQNPLKQPKK